MKPGASRCQRKRANPLFAYVAKVSAQREVGAESDWPGRCSHVVGFFSDAESRKGAPGWAVWWRRPVAGWGRSRAARCAEHENGLL